MLAVLGVAVAVVAAVALSQQRDTSPTAQSTGTERTVTRTAPAPSSSKPAPSSSEPAGSDTGGSLSLSGSNGGAAAAKKVPLIVLNNSTVSGLAQRVADQFRSGGWKVTNTDNLRNEIISSCAYYDPDTAGAKKAAEALREQFPGIKRVVPRFPELPSGPVVVVLTGDYDAG